MKERIQKLLHEYSISSTYLADKIGVQRSSISHLLSGRNKPGFDFIQKLLKNYPEINPNWLILGNGPMYVTKNQATLPFSEAKEESSSRESNIRSESNKEDQIRNSQKDISGRKKEIEKIVIFYSDHSFDEYRPNE
ncbi:MAG: helix-turn-helix domain-containing protein [Bacteroidota bacterium]